MGLVQIAQHADDLGRATAFYRDLLGSEPVATFDPPGLVFFDVGGVRLLLDQGAPSALHYLRVDDIDATVERLRVAGTDEWMAFVVDSEGNLVGLVEQRPRG